MNYTEHLRISDSAAPTFTLVLVDKFDFYPAEFTHQAVSPETASALIQWCLENNAMISGVASPEIASSINKMINSVEIGQCIPCHALDRIGYKRERDHIILHSTGTEFTLYTAPSVHLNCSLSREQNIEQALNDLRNTPQYAPYLKSSMKGWHLEGYNLTLLVVSLVLDLNRLGFTDDKIKAVFREALSAHSREGYEIVQLKAY